MSLSPSSLSHATHCFDVLTRESVHVLHTTCPHGFITVGFNQNGLISIVVRVLTEHQHVIRQCLLTRRAHRLKLFLFRFLVFRLICRCRVRGSGRLVGGIKDELHRYQLLAAGGSISCDISRSERVHRREMMAGLSTSTRRLEFDVA